MSPLLPLGECAFGVVLFVGSVCEARVVEEDFVPSKKILIPRTHALLGRPRARGVETRQDCPAMYSAHRFRRSARLDDLPDSFSRSEHTVGTHGAVLDAPATRDRPTLGYRIAFDSEVDARSPL